MLLSILISVILPVLGQRDFDRLGERIDSVLTAGERDVEVVFEPGIYFFRNDHLCFSGVDAPDVVLRLKGNGAVLVGTGEGDGYTPDKGYADLAALVSVDVRQPVRKARSWPIPRLFRKGMYKILCHEPDRSERDAADMRIILSQWFKGADYKVVRIKHNYLYFRKDTSPRTRMWSELRFGRCLPRYILCTPPERTDLYAASASRFLLVKDSSFQSFELAGFLFLVNGAGEPLLDFSTVRTDSVRITDCQFEGLRSQAIRVDGTDHMRITDNEFRKCYLGAISVSARSRDARIEDCRFLDNGIQMTNTPIVDCKGEDFLVRGNYFEDFSYSAIGVGLHFTDTVGCVTSGKVEGNEICMSEAFRSGVPRELVDGGAIYVWTQNKDVSICRNYIHDIDGPHGNRGIFADDGAVNVEISGNLLLNIAGGRGIDLRRAFRVQRKKASVIRKVNVGNRMMDNVLDARCRFFVRRKDKTSFKGENRRLPKRYDREAVVREWKSMCP